MCWEFLIGMGIVLFQILLCIYLWWSFLFSQLIQWLGDFWLLKLHSWNKFHLVTMYYPFVCYWIQFSNFCKYFLYLCLWETLVCSFLVMSLVVFILLPGYIAIYFINLEKFLAISSDVSFLITPLMSSRIPVTCVFDLS